ncbi:hypothetical protein [Motilimonas sp. KMU-193]|uniref:hypothetical protein n=1 Tax=Motilimonas sp. KMU-193 TaxID=3388668 RepID=UPI00396AFED0
MKIGLLGYQKMPDAFSTWLESSDIEIKQYKSTAEFVLDQKKSLLALLVSTFQLDNGSIVSLIQQYPDIAQDVNLVVTECKGVSQAVQAMQVGAKEALPDKIQSAKLMALGNQYANH